MTCMDNCDDNDSGDREKSFYSFRPFKDQLDDIEWLIAHKYHGNRTKAQCFRDALDQYIEREKK
jgi:hypothetical protein